MALGNDSNAGAGGAQPPEARRPWEPGWPQAKVESLSPPYTEPAERRALYMAAGESVWLLVFRIGIRHCTISLMDGQQQTNVNDGQPTQFAPGDTIRPQQAPAAGEVETAASVAVQPLAPATPPMAPPQPPIQDAPAPPPLAPEVQTPPVETPQPAMSAPVMEADDVVRWSASEFIAHNKTSSWYALLLLAAAVAAAIIWLLTKDVVSAVVVVFAGVMLATFAAHKPRQLTYQLDPSGLTIGQRYYSFNDFRSFSVVPEGAFSSIVFTPMKRFSAWITIYYDPQDEEKIVSVISQRLPHEERKPDVIDSMMRRIRF